MVKRLLSLVLVICLIGIISACSGTTEETSTNDDVKQVEKEKEPKKQRLNKKIKLNDQFVFEYFAVELDKVKIYEKNDKAYMDLEFDWRNNFGEEAKFIRAGSVFAYQGENELEEITYAYSDTKSHVHFPNAAGGTWGIDLTFELNDKETPVKVVFVSHETEKEEELQIDLK